MPGYRADVPICPRIDSCDADPWRAHAGEMVENDPHRIESQVHRSYIGPAISQVFTHEPPVAVLGSRLAAQERGR